ncbi:MAG: chromosomal replication initiator protein DnaA [Spirochaetales bacterium]|nr:chromosomal replication initiator protein DnaA [Candidatus Physcosoma equi]
MGDTLPQRTIKFLEKISLKDLEEDKATLAVASEFILDSIKGQKAAIENILSEKLGSNVKVEFIVDSEVNKEIKETAAKETVKETKETMTFPKFPARKNPTLNPKYTLDNFIQGDNSDIAYRAAQVIAMNPGTTNFNPCLIYGGVGLGKTHLLQAIGNYIYDKNPDMNVVYVTAESFTNEFINSFGSKESNNKFKKTYRNADVLLIDDIHFLQQKSSTQEELFHTFVELHHNNKQIVFTCDRPITELSDITDRLRTRFSSGLNVDLRPPEYEIRVAIARQKSKDLGLNIPDDVIDYICQAVRTNVRDLEGSLITISGIAKLIGKPATIEIAKDQLKNVVIEPVTINTNYSINDVFTATANYFNVSLVDMKGASRSTAIKVPRQIAIYISYKYGHFTQSDIGKYLNKDHTSIRYSFSQVDSQKEVDESLRKAIEAINKMLNEK